MRHPTTTLISCDGEPVGVDVDMVPVITALWRRGVQTCNGCCQGEPDGTSYVMFPDIGEADKFSALVMDGGAAPNLVAGGGQWTDDGDYVESTWQWQLGGGGGVRFPLIERC